MEDLGEMQRRPLVHHHISQDLCPFLTRVTTSSSYPPTRTSMFFSSGPRRRLGGAYMLVRVVRLPLVSFDAVDILAGWQGEQ